LKTAFHQALKRGHTGGGLAARVELVPFPISHGMEFFQQPVSRAFKANSK